MAFHLLFAGGIFFRSTLSFLTRVGSICLNGARSAPERADYILECIEHTLSREKKNAGTISWAFACLPQGPSLVLRLSPFLYDLLSSMFRSGAIAFLLGIDLFYFYCRSRLIAAREQGERRTDKKKPETLRKE